MTRILEVLDGSPRWVIVGAPREAPGNLREWRMHRAPSSICLGGRQRTALRQDQPVQLSGGDNAATQTTVRGLALVMSVSQDRDCINGLTLA